MYAATFWRFCRMVCSSPMTRRPDDTSAAAPVSDATTPGPSKDNSLKLIPPDWKGGTEENSGRPFAFIGAAGVDVAERNDDRKPSAPPQEGFVRRLLFDMCDKDLKAGRPKSSMLVNGRPLSASEMRSIVAYARRYGFLK